MIIFNFVFTKNNYRGFTCAGRKSFAIILFLNDLEDFFTENNIDSLENISNLCQESLLVFIIINYCKYFSFYVRFLQLVPESRSPYRVKCTFKVYKCIKLFFTHREINRNQGM
jgi:hypothetical protein